MITEIEQNTLDIDWFFTDGEYIAFATSAGGKLPSSVSKSSENLEILSLYFSNLPQRCEIVINPDLKKIINDTVTDTYLSSFIFMAEKGLFSYDRTVPSHFSDPNYHLVAKPSNPLSVVELPKQIIEILSKTQCGRLDELINITSL